jgi:basic amino acid/polyamine antiporter, APA family
LIEASSMKEQDSRQTAGDLHRVVHQAQELDDVSTLQRKLEAWQLMTLGIGAIIGAGIFVATGHVAAHHTGPAIVLSFLLALLACLCAGLCYAEFAAMMPVSGSAYSYVRAAFGNAAGWGIGWCLILEYLMAAATVAVGWSGYLKTLLSSAGMRMVEAFSAAPFTLTISGELARSGRLLNLPAVALIAVITFVLARGLRVSMRMNAWLVAVKLGVIALFIVCGAFFIEPENWRPFLPSNTGVSGEFGWSGVLRGAAIIFYAYLGFDTVSTAARETRNPQRNVPIGVIGSLVFCTAVYIVFCLVLTGIAPYGLLGVPSPMSAALDHVGAPLHFLKVTTELGAVVGLTSVVLVLLYGQSRILYAMSRDGLVPPALGRIDARMRTPYVSILLSGAVALLAAGAFPLEVLSELISIGTLCAFIFVCGGVLYLRRVEPALRRPFRTPAATVVCTTGIVMCGYLLTGFPWATWWKFLSWMLLGACIYLAYGRRMAQRAKVQFADSVAI